MSSSFHWAFVRCRRRSDGVVAVGLVMFNLSYTPRWVNFLYEQFEFPLDSEGIQIMRKVEEVRNAMTPLPDSFLALDDLSLQDAYGLDDLAAWAIFRRRFFCTTLLCATWRAWRQRSRFRQTCLILWSSFSDRASQVSTATPGVFGDIRDSIGSFLQAEDNYVMAEIPNVS